MNPCYQMQKQLTPPFAIPFPTPVHLLGDASSPDSHLIAPGTGAHSPRVLRAQRVPKALRDIQKSIALVLSHVGIIRLAPRLSELGAVRAIRHTGQQTQPGVKEVAGCVAAIALRVCTVIGCVGGTLGGAEGCV